MLVSWVFSRTHGESQGHAGIKDQTGSPGAAACDLGLMDSSLPCRKRENSLQEDRDSFVTTPTAELSSQEETLLGSLLDWSLDCYSGYEGDQESEGEKEGDGEWCGGMDPAGGMGSEGHLAPCCGEAYEPGALGSRVFTTPQRERGWSKPVPVSLGHCWLKGLT